MKNIILGLILIILGVIIGLNTFGITSIDIFFDGWWTLFIIIPAILGLSKEKDKTGNIILLLIGILLFLACQDILNFDLIWKLIIQIVLVVIGLSFIFKDTFNKQVVEEIKKINKLSKDNEVCATFSEQKINYDNERFKSSEISAIFGSVKLDLRNAILDDDVVINTTSIFGGIDIYVPKNVKVKVKSSSIFGGVDEKTKKNDGKVTIYINATCVFGGVDIK